MGSSVRRNRLSDITNTVSSAGIGISRTSCSDDDKENANVMPSPRPKDCISQLMKVHDFCLCRLNLLLILFLDFFVVLKSMSFFYSGKYFFVEASR